MTGEPESSAYESEPRYGPFDGRMRANHGMQLTWLIGCPF